MYNDYYEDLSFTFNRLNILMGAVDREFSLKRIQLAYDSELLYLFDKYISLIMNESEVNVPCMISLRMLVMRLNMRFYQGDTSTPNQITWMNQETKRLFNPIKRIWRDMRLMTQKNSKWDIILKCHKKRKLLNFIYAVHSKILPISDLLLVIKAYIIG